MKLSSLVISNKLSIDPSREGITRIQAIVLAILFYFPMHIHSGYEIFK